MSSNHRQENQLMSVETGASHPIKQVENKSGIEPEVVSISTGPAIPHWPPLPSNSAPADPIADENKKGK